METLREIVEDTLLPMHAEAVSDEVGVEFARTVRSNSLILIGRFEMKHWLFESEFAKNVRVAAHQHHEGCRSQHCEAHVTTKQARSTNKHVFLALLVV